MAGHSKFKNIMHRKGAQDAKRATKFARLTKELQVAVRGGTDPSSNPRLRSALAACRSVNMPKDNIERVIKKAETGQSSNLEEIRYEGYASGGIALIVDAVTDNRNRTAAEVRSSFTKYGGTLGETGSVSFMFNNIGQIIYNKNIKSDEDLFEIAIDVGADDVNSDENNHEIFTSVNEFNNVREKLEKLLGMPEQAEIIWQPVNFVKIDDENIAVKSGDILYFYFSYNGDPYVYPTTYMNNLINISLSADPLYSEKIISILGVMDDLKYYIPNVDILVNNAGASAAALFEDVTDKNWEDDINLKLMSTIRMCRLVIPHMKASSGGVIINATIGGGKAPNAGSLPTTVTRAAGINLTKSLANQYAKDNIRVNTICIGLIKSAQWDRRAGDGSVENLYEEMSKKVPMGKVGEEIDYANLVAFLSSHRSAYITGTAINLDGGLCPVV